MRGRWITGKSPVTVAVMSAAMTPQFKAAAVERLCEGVEGEGVWLTFWGILYLFFRGKVVLFLRGTHWKVIR